KQPVGNWRRLQFARLAIIGLAEECDATLRDDATHLERRELEACDLVEERRFAGGRDEVVAILKAGRGVDVEQHYVDRSAVRSVVRSGPDGDEPGRDDRTERPSAASTAGLRRGRVRRGRRRRSAFR